MTKKRNPGIIDYFGFFLMLFFIFFFRFLPYEISLRLASILGFLSYYILPIRKKIVLQNIKKLYGDNPDKHEIRRIARRCYQHTTMTFAEIIISPSFSDKKILSLFGHMEGEEYFKEVGSEQGSYFVVTGHLGNWELLGSYFVLRGVPLTVLARPLHNNLWDNYITTSRRKKGIQLLSTRESSRQIITHVREGRVVAFLVDQDARRNGIFVDFLGTPASTFAGPAIFMQRFKKPILPCFSVRTHNGLHKIIFKSPILPIMKNGDYPTDDDTIQQIVQQYTHVLESVIREYPEQYFWFHRRWKTKPKHKSVCRREILNSSL